MDQVLRLSVWRIRAAAVAGGYPLLCSLYNPGNTKKNIAINKDLTYLLSQLCFYLSKMSGKNGV